MSQATWLAKRNYWIAGIGAIVALFSFLALNFLSISYSFSLPDLGTGSTTSTPTTPVSIPVAGTSLASYEGLLWVSVVLVLGVLGVAIWFLVRRSPFGLKAPMKVQARWTALSFVVAAVLSALCLVASLSLISQSYQNLVNGSLGNLGSLGSSFSDLFHFDFAWGVGAYFFLAGLIVIVVASILEVIWPTKILTDAEMALQWNYPQSQYTQNQYTYPDPQNQYTYPPATYGPNSVQGPQPFGDPNSQYGGSSLYPGSSYPPVSGQQPPADPYQPPSQYPPYGQ
jgi:hypothetical protein